jgi:hypothetical protein
MTTPAEYMEIVIRTKAAALGYAIAIDHMQDKPDKMIVLINGKGKLDPRNLNGNQTKFDLVEIHVRGIDYADTSAVLPTLWETVLKDTRLTSAYGKIVQSISMANTMGCLGQEPQNRRWRFCQNFFITVI